MKRALSAHHSTRPKARVQPSAEHAEIALREARLLMAPVALWLLRNGVSYPAFAETLKRADVHFRNDMETGPGGRQIQIEDPDGNPIELFEPAR